MPVKLLEECRGGAGGEVVRYSVCRGAVVVIELNVVVKLRGLGMSVGRKFTEFARIGTFEEAALVHGELLLRVPNLNEEDVLADNSVERDVLVGVRIVCSRADLGDNSVLHVEPPVQD